MIILLLKKHKLIFIVSILSILISSSSSAYLLTLINSFLNSNNNSSDLSLPWFLAVIFVLTSTLILSKRLLNRLGLKIACELRENFSTKIINSKLSHVEKIGESKLYAHLTTDIDCIAGVFTVLPSVLFNSCLVVGVFVYLFILSSYLFFLFLAGLIICLLVAWKVMNLVENQYTEYRTAEDSLFHNFSSAIKGGKELRQNTQKRDHFINQSLKTTTNNLYSIGKKAADLIACLDAMGMAILYLLIALVLYIGTNSNTIDSGTISGFVVAIIFIATPISELITEASILSRGSVAINKVRELDLSFNHDSFLPSNPASSHSSFIKEITFNRLTYAYHDRSRSFVVGPISFSAMTGSITFITGGNGSGKTTLAKLLCGLYHPNSGEIIVDGTQVDHQDIQSYRDLFSCIFFDFYLFDTLLSDKLESNEALVGTLIEKLQLSTVINRDFEKLPASELSQGQRKRLAMLVSLVEDRDIIIFDEWAADQDPEFRNVFYMQILPELKSKGKIVIAITHDDRYYDLADQLIKLEDGRITSIKTSEKLKFLTSLSKSAS